MNWSFAAQSFFGLNPDAMSAQQALLSLQAQSFEQIAKPKPPPPGSSVSKRIDALNTELDWFGFRPYDFRLRPKLLDSTVAYIELHPCPATDKLAEVVIAYRAIMPVAQFGKMTAEITHSLALEPVTSASKNGLVVTWNVPGSFTAAAHWSKGLPPQIQLIGSRESIDCRLSFGAGSSPED